MYPVKVSLASAPCAEKHDASVHAGQALACRDSKCDLGLETSRTGKGILEEKGRGGKRKGKGGEGREKEHHQNEKKSKKRGEARRN